MTVVNSKQTFYFIFVSHDYRYGKTPSVCKVSYTSEDFMFVKF